MVCWTELLSHLLLHIKALFRPSSGKNQMQDIYKSLTTLKQEIHKLFLRYLYCSTTLHIPAYFNPQGAFLRESNQS
jgi:DNA anti-recombination protein RmuC